MTTRRRLLAAAAASLLVAPARAGEPVIRSMPWPQGLRRPSATVVYRERDVGAFAARFEVEGRSRLAHLYGGADGGPAVLLLHGAGRGGRSMIDMWRAAADRHGLRLIAPDSLGETWDLSVDGPAFLTAAVGEAGRLRPFDPARLHLFGHSAGAAVALLLANRAPGPWRAVATHGGLLPARLVAPARGAPPVRMYLGTEDHLFSLADARETARALAEAGHATELVEIDGHTHWYYVIGPTLSEEAWRFFAAA